MVRQLPVSLIVPLGGSADQLLELLRALACGTAWPYELLVVVASREAEVLPEVWQNLLATLPNAFSSSIRVLPQLQPLFPGAARNKGIIAASCEWIGFLDVNTIPAVNWLEFAFASADAVRRPAVLGATQYLSCSWQQHLFIQATYGELPLQTLPGSLIHRNVFALVGGFLPCIRAGEDTDWLIRLRQFGFDTSPLPVPALIYRAVPRTLSSLACKWYRNYTSSAPVVFHLETQKTIYLLVANFLILFVAFRWNALVAGWRESSVYYFANISKIILLMLVLGYSVLRGLIMPLCRGSSAKILLPWRWVIIAAISFVLDMSKLSAFIFPPWRRMV